MEKEKTLEHSIIGPINNGYKEDLQIDRVDNNLGYKQSNCRFVTAKQNNRNRIVTKLVEYKGETKPLAELV